MSQHWPVRPWDSVTAQSLAVALAAGSALDEHENPGEATVQVLHGRVRLTAGQVAWEGRTGDLLVVPDARHALAAIEDSAILLTVSKAIPARRL